MNIYLSEANILRRIYLRYLLKRQLSFFSKGKYARIYSTSELSDMKRNVALSSINNIYFLSVDLNNDRDLKLLRQIRDKDPLGHIVLFTMNTNALEKLFSNRLSILGYLDRRSSKKEYKAKVTECIQFVFE